MTRPAAALLAYHFTTHRAPATSSSSAAHLTASPQPLPSSLSLSSCTLLSMDVSSPSAAFAAAAGSNAASASAVADDLLASHAALGSEMMAGPMTSLSTSSTAAAMSDDVMSESYDSSPASSPSLPLGRQQSGQSQITPSLYTWPESASSSLSATPFSLSTHAGALQQAMSLSLSHSAPGRTSQADQPSDMPRTLRSISDTSFPFASSEFTSPSSSSSAPSSFDTPSGAVSVPAFHLQPHSARYVDTYLGLVSTDLYSFFDDHSFRTLYLEHIIHIADPQPRAGSRARLLCVASVLAIGARIAGNTTYAAQCCAVARYCARSIRTERPSSMEDIALAYRGLLALSYFHAAMLDPSEAEWLAIADSLVAIDGARPFIPAGMIHLLHQMPPSFTDALSLPSDQLCEQVVAGQMHLYAADSIKYRRVKRLLRQLISTTDEQDDEMGEAVGELPVDEQADITASLTSCSASKLVALHRSVCLALSNVHRRPAISFSVYGYLISALCAEAAALPTNQRSGVYSVKLGCYLLLGRKREAVQAARDVLMFHVGPGRLPSESGAEQGLIVPFALSFVRSIVVLTEWDDSPDVPSLITAALRLFHANSQLWPAAQSVEAELIERLHRRRRVDMDQANVQSERVEQAGSGSSGAGGGSAAESQSKSAQQSNTTRLQTAIRMELALDALKIEWSKRE